MRSISVSTMKKQFFIDFPAALFFRAELHLFTSTRCQYHDYFALGLRHRQCRLTRAQRAIVDETDLWIKRKRQFRDSGKREHNYIRLGRRDKLDLVYTGKVNSICSFQDLYSRSVKRLNYAHFYSNKPRMSMISLNFILVVYLKLVLVRISSGNTKSPYYRTPHSVSSVQSETILPSQPREAQTGCYIYINWHIAPPGCHLHSPPHSVALPSLEPKYVRQQRKQHASQHASQHEVYVYIYIYI